MTTSDFTTTLLLDQPTKTVFESVNNVRGWWSEEIEGDTDTLDAEFSYRFEDLHACRIQLIELVPDEKVVWLVKQNYFKFTKDNSEWTGTKIRFDITEREGRTQLRFTHVGLVPDYECFEVCSNAWQQYIGQSLHDLITTGAGRPNGKGKPTTADEVRLLS